MSQAKKTTNPRVSAAEERAQALASWERYGTQGHAGLGLPPWWAFRVLSGEEAGEAGPRAQAVRRDGVATPWVRVGTDGTFLPGALESLLGVACQRDLAEPLPPPPPLCGQVWALRGVRGCVVAEDGARAALAGIGGKGATLNAGSWPPAVRAVCIWPEPWAPAGLWWGDVAEVGEPAGESAAGAPAGAAPAGPSGAAP